MLKKGKFLIFFLVMLTLVACIKDDKRSVDKEKPIVYASFFPIYNLTKMVAQDDVELRSFMPTSATVHEWEPTARDLKKLKNADLLIINGANVERWADNIKESLPDLKILRLSDNVDLISYTGAASLGDFQLMTRYDYKDKKQSLVFGHTHEEYLRVAFKKDDGKHTDDELIKIGRKIMEEMGDEVRQDSVLNVEDGKVYSIKMRHESGELEYVLPEEGKWIVYTDRLPEDILPFEFYEGENEIKGEEILRGSSQEVDKVTYDPHSWLSINNAKTYVNTIAREIENLVPEKSAEIESRRFNTVDNLTLLQREYRNKFKELTNKEFIVMHYAFQYLARDFKLIQYPLQGLTSMDDPSIKSMVRAIDYAKKSNIKTIFYEYGAPKSVANVIAEEIDGGDIKPLASMEYIIPGQTVDSMDYIELMRMNLENLYEEMKRQNE